MSYHRNNIYSKLYSMAPMRIMPVRSAPVSTLQRIKDLLKKYKVVSRGLSGLSHVLPQYATPLSGLSGVASSMGYGRRRRRAVRRRRVVHRRRRVAPRRRRAVGAGRRRVRRVRRVRRYARRK